MPRKNFTASDRKKEIKNYIKQYQIIDPNYKVSDKEIDELVKDTARTQKYLRAKNIVDKLSEIEKIKNEVEDNKRANFNRIVSLEIKVPFEDDGFFEKRSIASENKKVLQKYATGPKGDEEAIKTLKAVWKRMVDFDLKVKPEYLNGEFGPDLEEEYDNLYAIWIQKDVVNSMRQYNMGVSKDEMKAVEDKYVIVEKYWNIINNNLQFQCNPLTQCLPGINLAHETIDNLFAFQTTISMKKMDNEGNKEFIDFCDKISEGVQKQIYATQSREVEKRQMQVSATISEYITKDGFIGQCYDMDGKEIEFVEAYNDAFMNQKPFYVKYLDEYLTEDRVADRLFVDPRGTTVKSNYIDDDSILEEDVEEETEENVQEFEENAEENVEEVKNEEEPQKDEEELQKNEKELQQGQIVEEDDQGEEDNDPDNDENNADENADEAEVVDTNAINNEIPVVNDAVPVNVEEVPNEEEVKEEASKKDEEIIAEEVKEEEPKKDEVIVEPPKEEEVKEEEPKKDEVIVEAPNEEEVKEEEPKKDEVIVEPPKDEEVKEEEPKNEEVVNNDGQKPNLDDDDEFTLNDFKELDNNIDDNEDDPENKINNEAPKKEEPKKDDVIVEAPKEEEVKEEEPKKDEVIVEPPKEEEVKEEEPKNEEVVNNDGQKPNLDDEDEFTSDDFEDLDYTVDDNEDDPENEIDNEAPKEEAPKKDEEIVEAPKEEAPKKDEEIVEAPKEEEAKEIVFKEDFSVFNLNQNSAFAGKSLSAKFNGLDDMTAFASTLLDTIKNDPALSGKIQIGENPFGEYDIDAYLSKFYNSDNVDRNGINIGYDVKLSDFANSAKNFIKNLALVTDSSKTEQERTDAMRIAELDFFSMCSVNKKTMVAVDDLKNFLLRNDHGPVGNKNGKFLVGLVRAFDNVHNMYFARVNKSLYDEALATKDVLANMKKSLESGMGEIVTECNKMGINFTEIEQYYQSVLKESQDIKAKLQEIESPEYREKINSEAKKVLDATQKRFDEIFSKVEKSNKTISNLNNFLTVMKQNATGLEFAEADIDAINSNIKPYLDERQKLTEEKIMLLSRKNEREEIVKQYKEMLALPGNILFIRKYERELDRSTMLNEALQEMEKLVSDKFNVNEAIRMLNQDIALTDDQVAGMEIYNQAKTKIVNYFSSSMEKQSEIKEYFEKLENEFFTNAPLKFINDQKNNVLHQLNNAKAKIADMQSEKKELIDNYWANRDAEKKVNSDDTRINEIDQRLTSVNELINDKQRRIKADKELLCNMTKAAYNALGKGKEYKEGDYFAPDTLKKMINEAVIEAVEESDEIQNSKEVKELIAQRAKAEKEFEKTLPDNFKKELEKTREKSKKLDATCEKIKTLNIRKQSIKTLHNQMISLEDSLKKGIADTFSPSTAKKTKDGINGLYNELGVFNDGLRPKEKNSRVFNEMYDAVKNLADNLNNNFSNVKCTNVQLADILREVKRKADNYLEAKSQQWRPWIFSSEMRHSRIHAAQGLSSFCDNMAKELEKLPDDCEKVINDIKRNVESEKILGKKFTNDQLFNGMAENVRIEIERKNQPQKQAVNETEEEKLLREFNNTLSKM